MSGFDQNLFSRLLAQKYTIMQQQADADTSRASAGMLTAQSGANLDNVRAGLMPRQSAADIAQTQAATAGQLETNKYIGPLATSQMGLQRTQARQNTAQAGYYDSEAAGNSILSNGPESSRFMQFLQRIRSGQPIGNLGL